MRKPNPAFVYSRQPNAADALQPNAKALSE
jgi:hypothetical protein